MTLPIALPSSTGTRHRTHTVLIDQYSCGMRSIGCSSTHLLLKLLLIYGSVFVSFSLRLPPSVHVNLPWTNLSPLSPSMQWSAVNARGSYIVPGATLLGAVLIWYTVNRLLQQTLLHKPLPFFGFVFVFLSNMFTVGSSKSATLVLPVYIHTYVHAHYLYIIIYICVCVCMTISRHVFVYMHDWTTNYMVWVMA